MTCGKGLPRTLHSSLILVPSTILTSGRRCTKDGGMWAGGGGGVNLGVVGTGFTASGVGGGNRGAAVKTGSGCWGDRGPAEIKMFQ